MIPYLKPSLPDLNDYVGYLHEIWNRRVLTNNGPLLMELENRLQDFLGVPYVTVVSSGTIALQIAIECLNIKGEVITTPFSHISTTTAALWQRLDPIFVDIEDQHFCLDSRNIETFINDKTSAILATHVFGHPCNVDEIQSIADKHKLKIIYDGAQAFDVKIKGKSIFGYGDLSIVSFNATKLFHTAEGGAIICRSEELYNKCRRIRAFGQNGNTCELVGINGKNSELHAAMGLCNLRNYFDYKNHHKKIYDLYEKSIKLLPLSTLTPTDTIDYNYSYFPILTESAEQSQSLMKHLALGGIETKCYFKPSLNTLHFTKYQMICPIAEDISQRIICLPLYSSLSIEEVKLVCQQIDIFFKSRL